MIRSPFHKNWTKHSFFSCFVTQIFSYCVVYLSESVFVNTVVASMFDCGYNNSRDSKRAQNSIPVQLSIRIQCHGFGLRTQDNQPSKRCNNAAAKWKIEQRIFRWLNGEHWSEIIEYEFLLFAQRKSGSKNYFENWICIDIHHLTRVHDTDTLHGNHTLSERRRWINKNKTLLHFPLA